MLPKPRPVRINAEVLPDLWVRLAADLRWIELRLPEWRIGIEERALLCVEWLRRRSALLPASPALHHTSQPAEARERLTHVGHARQRLSVDTRHSLVHVRRALHAHAERVEPEAGRELIRLLLVPEEAHGLLDRRALVCSTCLSLIQRDLAGEIALSQLERLTSLLLELHARRAKEDPASGSLRPGAVRGLVRPSCELLIKPLEGRLSLRGAET